MKNMSLSMTVLAALALAAPSRTTDLVVREVLPITVIAWHATMPVYNDSSACSSRVRKYIPASDSVTYYSRVWGLPIPYQWVFVDSSRQARGDTVRREYQTWIDKYYQTQHWIRRRVPNQEAQPDSSCMRALLLRMKVKQ